ncbi:hypothetical protein RND81_06G063900 [Saponaria officinalis]|uniref:Uncharacterized protein n=1 Tax=Saponaria officinalis TaxID=3572 RepID=A0AAW1K7D2_SAPOF
MAVADVSPTYGRSKPITKVKMRTLTEDSLGLEPLGNELLLYFTERMIAASTLKRNYVLQKNTGGKVHMYSLRHFLFVLLFRRERMN